MTTNSSPCGVAGLAVAASHRACRATAHYLNLSTRQEFIGSLILLPSATGTAELARALLFGTGTFQMATLKVTPIAFAPRPRLCLADTSVLIVEDEPLIALGIHAALSPTGASIIAATNGAEALELIHNAEISVAVLDINLGDRDCSAACRALSRRRIPFLFYTGYPNSEVLKEWPDAPVLIKPAKTRVIVERVAALAKRAG